MSVSPTHAIDELTEALQKVASGVIAEIRDQLADLVDELRKAREDREAIVRQVLDRVVEQLDSISSAIDGVGNR